MEVAPINVLAVLKALERMPAVVVNLDGVQILRPTVINTTAAVTELFEAAKEVTEAPALSADEIKAMARLINAVAHAGGGK